MVTDDHQKREVVRFMLRMPKDLKLRVGAKAENNFHSVNSEIVRLVEIGLLAEAQKPAVREAS